MMQHMSRSSGDESEPIPRVMDDNHSLGSAASGGRTHADGALPHDVRERLRAGDQAAFELVFRAQHSALLAFASRYIGDESRAAEVVQDVFLDLWQRRASLEIAGSVRGYLFGAVRQRALNLRRRDAIERDWVDTESVAGVRALHATPTRVDEIVERTELAARVQALLAQLPERCALTMHLRWRDGLSHAEIAQVMGISVKGVEAQLARGLRALQGALRP
jgi:RNA polymerase sigma-70 factor, ECF subfamily